MTTNKLVISNVPINIEVNGLYCLNDMHKASGGLERHKPKEWIKLSQTKELVEELSKGGNPPLEQNQPLKVIHGGNNKGTYVCKELVFSYAMWVSPKFHLAVIRAYDSLVTQKNPSPKPIPQNFSEALRLAADLADEKKVLEQQILVVQPKADALDRLANLDGSMNLTSTAKHLKVQRKALIQYLRSIRWIYKRTIDGPWLGYAKKEANGYLEHKATKKIFRTSEGEEERLFEQVRVTAKGLSRLAVLKEKNEF